MGLTDSPAWQALATHRKRTRCQTITGLFAADAQRAERYSLRVGGLFLDYSKNRVDDEVLAALVELAHQRELTAAIERMFAGQPINATEGRAVLHTALRNRGPRAVMVEGEDVMPAVRAVLERAGAFAGRVRAGEWRGYTGKPIRDVVNIGIGGSHLGPQMVTQALGAFASDDLDVHFVANVDATDIVSALRGLDPATTLFIVASKSFTTQETMVNAASARAWFLASGASEADIARHFVAVSTNAAAVREFGIDTEHMFVFWDWVGGRYSVWSAIGLPVMLAVGAEGFGALLDGAYEMDEHFRSAPLERNLPVLLALLGVWYVNFLDARTHAILPYDEYLRSLPDYLQQADMESNGKRVTLTGESVDYCTGPVLWGSPGTNGQHAFFQLLHQGTHLVPADFIACANSHNPHPPHHTLLLANCLAQTEALMCGRAEEQTRAALAADGHDAASIGQLAAHRTFPGNRPSNTILLDRLEPRTLGMLLAAYEHKIFVQGVIWGINSFDQWGVELGKSLANDIVPELRNGPRAGRQSSTASLIREIKKQKKQ